MFSANLRTAWQWTSKGRRKGTKKERVKGKGCRFAAAIRAGLGAVKTYFFIRHFMQKGKTRCSIKPHAHCFIFHLHPSQCFSAQTFCVPSLYPHTILLFLFPLCVIRLPFCPSAACSPTDTREWPLGPQGSSDTRSLAGHLCWLADL